MYLEVELWIIYYPCTCLCLPSGVFIYLFNCLFKCIESNATCPFVQWQLCFFLPDRKPVGFSEQLVIILLTVPGSWQSLVLPFDNVEIH